jgi:hypothetical protein
VTWRLAFLLFIALLHHADARMHGGSAGVFVGWSTLACPIVADGVTDNTTCFNEFCNGGLCNGPVIYCDTGAGTVVVAGSVVVQGGENIDFKSCPVEATLNAAAQTTAVFTQSNLNAPLASLTLQNMSIDRMSTGNLGFLFFIWANNWTMPNFAFNHYSAIGFLRGSNIDIGPGLGLNCLQVVQNPPFRIFSNEPSVPSVNKPTIDGVVANDYLHDIGTVSQPFCHGDGAFQFGPGNTGAGVWASEQDMGSDSSGNVDPNGSLGVENMVTASTSGPAILIGNGIDTAIPWKAHNLRFKNFVSSVGGSGMFIATNTAGILYGDWIIDNVAFDSSHDTTLNGTIYMKAAGPGEILAGGEFLSPTVTNAYANDFVLNTNVNGVTVVNPSFGAPTGAQAGNAVILRGDNGTTIEASGGNCTIDGDANSAPVLVGANGQPASTNTTINGCLASGVATGKIGFNVKNEDGGLFENLSATIAGGATSTTGLETGVADLSGNPGATNSQFLNNTGFGSAGFTNPMKCQDNGGTNSASGNTGATCLSPF